MIDIAVTGRIPTEAVDANTSGNSIEEPKPWEKRLCSCGLVTYPADTEGWWSDHIKASGPSEDDAYAADRAVEYGENNATVDAICASHGIMSPRVWREIRERAEANAKRREAEVKRLEPVIAKLRAKAEKACAKLGAVLRVWPPKAGLVAALRGQTGWVPVRCTLPPGVRFVAKHDLLSDPHRVHIVGVLTSVWDTTLEIVKQGTRECRCRECRWRLASIKRRSRWRAERYAQMLRDRRAQRSQAKSDRRCAVCGKKLSAKARRDQQFCGPACKQTAYRERRAAPAT